MKTLILTTLFALMSVTAQASILEIDLKKGTNYVSLNWSYEVTGCSSSHTDYSVIYSPDLKAYVVGMNVATDEPMASSTPTLLKPDFPNQCFAQVDVTLNARFKVLAYSDQTIEVVVPQNFFAAPKVDIEHAELLPLHIK